MRGLADSIADFSMAYNDKLASLFSPRKKERALTRSQVMALMLLARRPGQTATELGENLNMTKASLTGILDALEAGNLARRTADEADRRKSLIALTKMGESMAEGIGREFEAALAERIAPLSAGDREGLRRSLAEAASILAKL